MEEKMQQKELFEFEKPKRPAPRFLNLFPGGNTTAITLTIEKSIFIAIAVIMLIIIVYALGVEKGKSGALSQAKPLLQPKASVIAQPKPIVPADKPATQATPGSGPYYTVVVATLSKKESAQNEAQRLKKDGYDSFVYQSDSYYQICVGRYTNKDGPDTKAALNSIRKAYNGIYHDAYIKLR